MTDSLFILQNIISGVCFAENNKHLDLLQVKECLQEFILKHSDEKLLSGFKLETETVNGSIVKQSSGHYVIGDWIVEENDSELLTYYIKHHTKSITSKLTLTLKKAESKYEIIKINIY